MEHRRFEKSADKILSVFTDGSITNHDLIYVSFYTVINAYPEHVLDRIIEFTDHVKAERQRILESRNNYVQDTLF